MRIIREAEVLSLMPMERAIGLLEAAARDLAADNAVNAPRNRVKTADRMLHILPAGSETLQALGVKTYISGPDKPQFWYMLFSGPGLTAMIEADNLGRIRTGAASALATRLLSRPDADVLAVFGTGSQAFTQVAGVAAVRPLREVRVVARNAERAERFAADVRERLQLAVQVCDASTALADAPIIVTITSAREPLFAGHLPASGAHINAVGSNRPTHREIDGILLDRCARIVVEDVAQARLEAGDLLRAPQFDWQRVETLPNILVAGVEADMRRVGDGDLTLFESLGIGLWDLALAVDIVQRSTTNETLALGA